MTDRLTMEETQQDILCLSRACLGEELEALGQPRYRALQVFRWLHQRRAERFEEMTDLPRALREALAARWRIGSLPAVRRQRSKLDATEKYLLRLSDGNCVEAVWMEYRHGNTVCISTQVGCRMGCTFCASTLGGLVRSLTPGEMLGEVYALERESGKKAGGVVLMGIGEPLDNYEHVLTFLRLLADEEGTRMSLRHVSLSTCGIVPQIDRLADEGLPLTLSVSLHAPDDAARRRIMPVAREYPLPSLMAACGRYFERTGRRISYEYALIAGENDSPERAKALVALLRPLRPCHVNLIPVNEVRERKARRPARTCVEQFRMILERGGINATVRRELGADISAACGQLRREDSLRKNDVQLQEYAAKEETGECSRRQD